MAEIIPFAALRAGKEYVAKFTASAYDSDIREEEINKHREADFSYLHVLKPDPELTQGLTHDEIYAHSREVLNHMIERGILQNEKSPAFYIYRQIKRNDTFTCIIGLASTKEYIDGKIKKHELTRTEKEAKMTNYFRGVGVNGSPVLLTYSESARINELIQELVETAPIYSLVTQEIIHHQLWIVEDGNRIDQIHKEFEKIDFLYIADGHHRTASAASLYPEKDYFMSCLIPDTGLRVHAFNRYLKDMNGLQTEDFLELIKRKFNIIPRGKTRPDDTPDTICLYIEDNWYIIEIPDEIRNSPNPRQNLAVDILDTRIFRDIVGITDTRSSDKIKYINGEVSTEELLAPVQFGELKCLFTLYPVTVREVMAVSDYGETMPPKSTWIEPKLLSGLLIHKF